MCLLLASILRVSRKLLNLVSRLDIDFDPPSRVYIESVSSQKISNRLSLSSNAFPINIDNKCLFIVSLPVFHVGLWDVHVFAIQTFVYRV